MYKGRVYRGIRIDEDERSVANQLGVRLESLKTIGDKRGYETKEEVIDYYLDKKPDDVYEALAVKRSNSLDKWDRYVPDEIHMIFGMHKNGYRWSKVVEVLNDLQCNKRRGIKRNINSVRSFYSICRKT